MSSDAPAPAVAVAEVPAKEEVVEVKEEDLKFIQLRSNDNKLCSISTLALEQSLTMKQLMDSCGTEDLDAIPISNVDGKTLKKLIEWCEKHRGEEVPKGVAKEAPRNITIPDWDKEFLNINNTELFNLVCAANFMDVPLLLDYSCKTVALLGAGKSTEEMRIIYNIN